MRAAISAAFPPLACALRTGLRAEPTVGWDMAGVGGVTIFGVGAAAETGAVSGSGSRNTDEFSVGLQKRRPQVPHCAWPSATFISQEMQINVVSGSNSSASNQPGNSAFSHAGAHSRK